MSLIIEILSEAMRYLGILTSAVILMGIAVYIRIKRIRNYSDKSMRNMDLEG